MNDQAAAQAEETERALSRNSSERLRRVEDLRSRADTHVKVCGITRAADALFAAHSGADYLGYIFYAASPRHIAPHDAEAIISTVRAEHPRVRHIGVFVNAEPNEVADIAHLAGLDFAQLHGDESPAYVAELREDLDARLIKVMGFSGRRATSTHSWTDYISSVDHLLCDSFDPVKHGGTGQLFEHSALPEDFPLHRAFIAGGLTPSNVAGTVEQLRPFAVDVSSGVEEAPGRKSHALIEAFVRAAKNL